MTGWGSNLLATGVIVIAGLTFGRQVVEWWGVEPTVAPPPAAGVALDVGRHGAAHCVRLGDFPFLLERRLLTGDKQAVLAELRSGCRRRLAEADIKAAAAAPGPAQRRMLAGLTGLQPVEEVGRTAVIYELADGPAPLAVGVVLAGASQPNFVPPAGRIDDTPRPAGVVCWGMAVPRGPPRGAAGSSPSDWTLFIWSGEQTAASTLDPLGGWLPDAAERTLTVGGREGVVLTGFRLPGGAADWQAHFDRAARRRGMEIVLNWRPSHGVWFAGYRDADGATAHVNLFSSSPTETGGTLQWSPPSDRNGQDAN